MLCPEAISTVTVTCRGRDTIDWGFVMWQLKGLLPCFCTVSMLYQPEGLPCCLLSQCCLLVVSPLAPTDPQGYRLFKGRTPGTASAVPAI
jgi:hypothetical protein